MTATNYATREQIASAFDAKASAYLDDTLDRLADVASRQIERIMHRRFYPTIATKVIEWPDRGSFWLPDDLISVSALSIDGTTVTGFTLEPQTYGVPYDRIDFDDATSSGGDEVSITGVWGYSNDTRDAGSLAAAISSTSTSTITVSDASLVGIGDQLLIDSERLVVTGRSSTTTGTTIASDVASSAATTAVAVASGAAVHVGEVITIDSERMQVLDITGNTLLVRRAVDGSVLAAHTSGATVYARRLLTVSRADAGTTAATHLNSTSIYKNSPPPLITELCIAEVQHLLGQEQAGWNLTIGDGENQRESTGRSVHALREITRRLYQRGRWGRAV